MVSLLHFFVHQGVIILKRPRLLSTKYALVCTECRSYKLSFCETLVLKHSFSAVT